MFQTEILVLTIMILMCTTSLVTAKGASGPDILEHAENETQLYRCGGGMKIEGLNVHIANFSDPDPVEKSHIIAGQPLAASFTIDHDCVAEFRYPVQFFVNSLGRVVWLDSTNKPSALVHTDKISVNGTYELCAIDTTQGVKGCGGPHFVVEVPPAAPTDPLAVLGAIILVFIVFFIIIPCLAPGALCLAVVIIILTPCICGAVWLFGVLATMCGSFMILRREVTVDRPTEYTRIPPHEAFVAPGAAQANDMFGQSMGYASL